MKIAMVAAMEREVCPLIRGWNVREIERDGRRYRLFEDGDVVVVCDGIGAEAARRATEAVIGEANPVRVVSVGFAGALGQMKIGEVMTPRVVINATDGSRVDVAGGSGVLISVVEVAGVSGKSRLRAAYGADAVDMEAAAVAQGAMARGVEFAAVKSISDEADFAMPTMDGFVSSDGGFYSRRFAAHVAIRPWSWMPTIQLARNSTKASKALCTFLAEYIHREMPNAGKGVRATEAVSR